MQNRDSRVFCRLWSEVREYGAGEMAGREVRRQTMPGIVEARIAGRTRCPPLDIVMRDGNALLVVSGSLRVGSRHHRNDYKFAHFIVEAFDAQLYEVLLDVELSPFADR